MQLREFFAQVGGDYEDVIQRLASESVVVKFLRRFVDEPSYAQLQTSLKAGDIPTAFRAAHTLKGTAATLGLGTLTAAASALTEELRGASALPAATYVEAVDAAYAVAVKNIAEIEE